MVGNQLCADAGAQRPAGLRTADLEIEVGHPVVGTVDAEDLADDAELEHREVVQDEHGHTSMAMAEF